MAQERTHSTVAIPPEGAKPSRSYDDLPDEILLAIFSYFTPEEICSQLAHVSSKWHRIAKDTRLWRNLTLREISLLPAVKLFSRVPLTHLIVLHADNLCGVSFELLVALLISNCPQLQRFKYTSPITIQKDDRGYDLQSTSNETIQALAVGCQELTHIYVLGLVLFDTSLKVFEQFPVLKHLDVKLLFEDWVDSDKFDTDLKHLTTLNVVYTGPNCEYEYNQRFLPLINKYSGVIKSLVISQSYSFILLDNDTWDDICKCTNLTKLSARIDTEHALSSVSIRLPKLTYLRVRRPQHSTRLITVFANANCFSKLKRLRIDDHGAVDDAVLKVIGYRFASQLKSLTLVRGAKVTDKGIQYVITKCSALEELTLKSLTVNKSLNMIPKCLPMLNVLALYECKVDHETTNMLKSYNPRVKVTINNEHNEDDARDDTDSEYLPDDDDDE